MKPKIKKLESKSNVSALISQCEEYKRYVDTLKADRDAWRGEARADMALLKRTQDTLEKVVLHRDNLTFALKGYKEWARITGGLISSMMVSGVFTPPNAQNANWNAMLETAARKLLNDNECLCGSVLDKRTAADLRRVAHKALVNLKSDNENKN